MREHRSTGAGHQGDGGVSNLLHETGQGKGDGGVSPNHSTGNRVQVNGIGARSR
jgi:hypothetical protein